MVYLKHSTQFFTEQVLIYAGISTENYDYIDHKIIGFILVMNKDTYKILWNIMNLLNIQTKASVIIKSAHK